MFSSEVCKTKWNISFQSWLTRQHEPCCFFSFFSLHYRAAYVSQHIALHCPDLSRPQPTNTELSWSGTVEQITRTCREGCDWNGVKGATARHMASPRHDAPWHSDSLLSKHSRSRLLEGEKSGNILAEPKQRVAELWWMQLCSSSNTVWQVDLCVWESVSWARRDLF